MKISASRKFGFCMGLLMFAYSVNFGSPIPSSAEVIEQKLEYKEGSTRLVGYYYRDDLNTQESPGILLFSDWMGIGEFSKSKAKELAVEGYRVLVADVYGDGRVAKDSTEAGTLATKFKTDRNLMRERAKAAFEVLRKEEGVDTSRIAAIGFCFGGTVALELARTGAALPGVVSFHGGLETPDPALAKNIRAKILVLHGADDPFVPEKEVAAFEKEMKEANTNWELVKYSRTVHAFTNPAAGSDPTKGAAYNELSSQRAFQAMRAFFDEIF